MSVLDRQDAGDKIRLLMENLPTYDGTTAFRPYFEKAKLAFKVSKMNEDDALQLFPLKLSGKAHVAFNKLTPNQKDTFENAINNMLQELSKDVPLASLRQKLSEIEKSPNESIDEFADRVKFLTEKAFPQSIIDSDDKRSKLATDYFIRGLPKELIIEVRRQLDDNASLNDAIKAAITAENYLNEAESKQRKEDYEEAVFTVVSAIKDMEELSCSDMEWSFPSYPNQRHDSRSSE
uniref:Retrotransposon gag domain-containing protein n=1 Tax=Panagrolaimus sp. JU765 TaxID=591449 RepID=A0AC34R6K4_9BILA